MGKADLKIDWCTHQAAKYAVEHWHYSKRMPMPPLVMVGAWERGKYIGCILFARGANMNIGAPYGLAQTECAELVRAALRDHETPVSRIMAIAFKFLRKNSNGIRLIVSYADPRQNHHGGIYQATNWIYVGSSGEATEYLHEGRWKHSREVTADSFGKSGGGSAKVANWQLLPRRKVPGKHKYLFPLDDDMRKRIASLSKPYPKKSVQIGVEPSSPTGGR